MSIQRAKQSSALASLVAIAFGCQLTTAQDAENDRGIFNLASHEMSHDGLNLLQMRHKAQCGPVPQIQFLDKAQNVDSLIEASKGVFAIAIPNMACTAQLENTLTTAGVDYKMVELPVRPEDAFQYKKGKSPVWDWLHCTYPDDMSNGMVMHSYVFLDGEFIGNGFDAAKKIMSGQLDAKLSKLKISCEERFPKEGKVVEKFMSNTSSHVLLFGWTGCPCVGIARQRFVDKQVCYTGREWADPMAPLMRYLQCREKDMESHSFIYFRTKSGDWAYQGNGFAFDEDVMTDAALDAKLATTDVSLTCKRPNVKINVYGSQLEECQVGDDDSGSWMDDGTCSEQTGGIHQICIEELPGDFSSETRQPPWSMERRGMRHCVCVGAWSLYLTEQEKHKEGADKIMPHCAAIPETTLTPGYLAFWKNWNGYAANVLMGVGELVLRCLAGTKSTKDKCGLKRRFEKLRDEPDAKELRDASQLEPVLKEFAKLTCPEEEEEASLLQYEYRKEPCDVASYLQHEHTKMPCH